MLEGITIALGDQDIVNVSSIQYDIKYKSWYVRTLEQTGSPPLYPGPLVMALGKGKTLEDAMDDVALNHKIRRESFK